MNIQYQKHQRNQKIGSYVGGIVLIAVGGAMVLGFGIPILVLLLVGAPVVPLAILSVFFLPSCAILAMGCKKCLDTRFQQTVWTAMQGKPRERLSYLSQRTGRDYTRLVAGLRKMGEKGIYPESYVDLERREFVVMPGGAEPPVVPGNTRLVETSRRSALPLYSAAAVVLFYALLFPLYRLQHFLIMAVLAALVGISLARILPRRIVIEEKPRPVEPPKPPETINTGNSELDEVLTAAMEYMAELTALDIAITNERIDKPVQEMVHICKQIFDYIKKTPEKIKQIRQFMDYYLPTTLKLLRNYEELSRQPVKGTNIQEAMTKIEDAMGTIVQAFRQELNHLYEDKALDISVDIEVLQNMLQQEGLDLDSLRQTAAGSSPEKDAT